MRIERVRRWLQGRRSERFETWINRYGAPVVVLATPWIGVWAVAATASALGMNQATLTLYASIGITAYAIVIGVGIAIGFGMPMNL